MAGKTHDDDDVPSGQNAFSFKIKTKSTKKIVNSTTDNFNKKEFHENDDEGKEYITSAEDKEIKSSVKKKDPSKLVIPMIAKNKWRTEASNGEGDDLTHEAVNEILNDLDSDNENNSSDIAIPIPLMMRNRLPPSKDGVEMDERYDISIRPEESSMEDYENIPVASFGSAMLRGMGWSEKKPIGGTNKAVCEPIEYIPRHKGLGLGAEKINGKESNKRKRKLGETAPNDSKYKPIIESDGRVRHIKKVGEEVPEQTKDFVPGKYVVILKKPHKDLYGKIISVDEDNTRISVKLSLSNEVIQLSQYNARIVDKIEANTAKTSKNNPVKEDNGGIGSQKNSYKQKDNENQSSSSGGSHWLHPSIKVRIISRLFKGGKYYNKKATVLDVVSIGTCSCKTEENKILDDVPEEYLETVIPKSKGSYVMIVNGKYRGRHAKLLDRHKTECLATVQLLSNKHITKISFDNLAEFTGELPDDEFL